MTPDPQLIERTKRRQAKVSPDEQEALQIRLDRYTDACKRARSEESWEVTARDRATSLKRVLDERGDK